MNTIIKSALNQIKTEDTLVNKTELYLNDALSTNKKPKLINHFKKRLTSKFLIAAASFLVILVGGSSATYAYYQTPVAYLSVDINPSVELGINAFGKVVSVEGYNDDGKLIVKCVDVTGSTVEEAIQKLILSANENGYIADDGSTVISLTSETSDTTKATTLQTACESGANEALAIIKKEAIVQKDNVALERRDESRALGITPGKLNLIYKLQEVDPTATIDDYKDASIKEIMKSIKTCSDNLGLNKEDNDDQDDDKATIEDTTIDGSEQTTAEAIQNNHHESDNDNFNNPNKTNYSDKNTLDTNVEKNEEYTIESNEKGNVENHYENDADEASDEDKNNIQINIKIKEYDSENDATDTSDKNKSYYSGNSNSSDNNEKATHNNKN